MHRIDGLAPESALRAELAAFAENRSTSSVADALGCSSTLDPRKSRKQRRMNRYHGRVVAITGAGQGLGHA
jgi:hypothetical protein